MSEREFWIAIRAALLGICSAIERKYISTGVAPGKGTHEQKPVVNRV